MLNVGDYKNPNFKIEKAIKAEMPNIENFGRY
jgi:hypothetical protein